MFRYKEKVQKNQEEHGGVNDRETVDAVGPILCKIKGHFSVKVRKTLSYHVSVEWKGQNTHACTHQRILSGKGNRNKRSARLVSKIDMLNAGFNFSIIVLQLQVKVYQPGDAGNIQPCLYSSAGWIETQSYLRHTLIMDYYKVK